MLGYYSKHFSAVEINSTFRSLPKPSILQAWVREVPPGFKFALKAQQQIRHLRLLNNAQEPLRTLLDLVGRLGSQSAPVLFQLPPNFRKNLPRLSEFLTLLPSACLATFEFRHDSWLDDDVFSLLEDHGIALCISDEVEDLTIPFRATADWSYLRLRRSDYSEAQLKQTLTEIKQLNWKVTQHSLMLPSYFH